MPRQKSSNKSADGKTRKRDPQNGPTVPVDFQAAPRAAQAMRLRRLGYTYAKIAQEVGYSDERNARRAVKNASDRIMRDEARELVGWQLDMLDAALEVVCKRIVADDKDSLWAVDRLAPLLKRQSELMALDKPSSEAQQTNVRRIYERR